MSERATPSLVGAGIAVGAALAATALTAISPLSLLADVAGVCLLGVGLVRRARPAVTLAAVGLLAGVAAAAIAGASTASLLAAIVAIALAYGAGGNALDVTRDAGDADSLRIELVHAAATVALAGAAAAGSYLLFAVSDDGLPALAVVALLVGGVLIVTGLGRGDPSGGGPD